MPFAFGLILGFCLGILCMALLFLTRSAEDPTALPVGNPAEEKHPPHSVVSPSEASEASSRSFPED